MEIDPPVRESVGFPVLAAHLAALKHIQDTRAARCVSHQRLDQTGFAP